MKTVLVVLAVAALGVVAFRADAASRLTVRSSIDGKTVLGHRVHWVAYTTVPESQVRSVDFLIDGKLRWTEHHKPYTYGGLDGDNYLVTSWLTRGLHRFTVRATSTSGMRATKTVAARVVPSPPPPAVLAGRWKRLVPAGGAPAGDWILSFDTVGLHLSDTLGYENIIDVAYLEPGHLEARGGIWMAPRDASHAQKSGGNGWCEDTNLSVGFDWSVLGRVLTLRHLGTDACGESDVLDGDWTRVS